MKKKDLFEILDFIELVKDNYICDSCLANVRMILEKELEPQNPKKEKRA